MQNHKTVNQLAIALNGKIVDAVSRVSGFVVSALFALDPATVTTVGNTYGGGYKSLYISKLHICNICYFWRKHAEGSRFLYS